VGQPISTGAAAGPVSLGIMTRGGSSWRALALLIAAVGLGAGGCAGTQGSAPAEHSAATGLVSFTVDHKLSRGRQPAYVFEIDGEKVNPWRGTYRVSAGTHEIRVWPHFEIPDSQQLIPDPALIAREDITVEAIEIEILAGHRYYLAARTNVTRTRTSTEGDVHAFPERKFVIPTVTAVVRPVPPMEAVKGIAGLLLPFVLVPAFVGLVY